MSRRIYGITYYLKVTILNFFMIFFSIICVYPIVWMLINAFKTEADFAVNNFGVPRSISFENISRAIFEGNMGRYAINSLVNSICTVIFVVIFAFVTAYILVRFNFKFSRILYNYFMIGLLIPSVALMVPMFMQFQTFNLLNRWYTLFIVYVGFGLPMSIFLIESFLQGIPIEIDEAALIDGAGTFTIMFKVVMPLCMPIISTVVILQFLSAWNEFPMALALVRDDALKSISLGLRNYSSQFSTNYTGMFAAMAVATIPVLVVYIFFNKKIIKGMTEGSVKL